MRRFQITFLILTILLCSVPLTAQDKPVIEVTNLTDQIFLLTTDQGAYTTNSLAFVGDDGVLLVDTQSEIEAEELKKVVDGFGKGLPKYIITTHRHVEHVGGNAIFGAEPVIISHHLCPVRLRQGSYLFNEFPKETFADITLTDSLTLYFNDEKIRLVNIGGSHDDNEIFVHFTKSKVVHLSSVVNGFNFPSTDSDGDIFMYAEVVKRAMDLLPDDVTIVSGHNPPGKYSQLQPYHDMMIATNKAVKDALDAGKDVAAMQEENILAEWAHYAGSYVSVNQWIQNLANAYEDAGKPDKKQIYEPLYYALKDGGAEAAIAKYRELKSQEPEGYEFADIPLLVIGDKLVDKGQVDAGIAILTLCTTEFPDGQYGYYTHYILATAYQGQGNKDMAIQCCEKSLELKPDFQTGATLLEELKKM